MRLCLAFQILIHFILINIRIDFANCRRILVNPQFEGCVRGNDESGEPERDPRAQISQRKTSQRPGKTTTQQHTSTPKYRKENEPKWTVHEKNLKYKPPLIDTRIKDSDKFNKKQLEEAIEQTDRETLFEWYDYAYGLKELLNLVEEGAKKCDHPPLSKPILDTESRINHALNAVSNKLRYGNCLGPRDSGTEEEQDLPEGLKNRPKIEMKREEQSVEEARGLDD